MSITGLNHITFSVAGLDRSLRFYCELLGFSIRMRTPSSAYLEAGTFWLALVLDSNVRGGPPPEYSHIALSIASSGLSGMVRKLKDAGVACWQESERGDSFYFLDPDGHKLELHSGDLHGRLRARAAAQDADTQIYE
jgi:catechol 2,3-dioxygenase-like lactoylglutathione lyase family enzyme